MQEPVQTPVQAGDVLAGKYRVESVLGAGGMGIVVAATHLQLDQPVALKFLLPQALVDPDVTGRFMREARAAVRLKSEHVARIIDVGTLESGSPYIVMEFLEGQDLARVLADATTLPVSLAVDYVLQACDAVAEAHALGIVHRDLKPANLFLTTSSHGVPLVKVLDFGISKSLNSNELTLTRTAAVMGSPAYMSPEQMKSAKHVDPRADIWSLGVILHELVTGRIPFVAESFTELVVRVATEPLPPMPAIAEGWPPGFEAVLRRALAKDAGERYQTVGELATALAPFTESASRAIALKISRSAGAAPPPVLTQSGSRLPQDTPLTMTTLGSSAGETLSGTRSPPSRKLLVGIMLGLAGAVVLAFVLLGGGPKPPATQPEVSPVKAPPPTVTPVVTPLAESPDAGVVVSSPPVEPKPKKPKRTKPRRSDENLFDTPD